jgi:hypothetical protein
MTTNIFSGNDLIAQVYDLNQISETNFPTPNNTSFQFGYGKILSDKQYNPHIHKRVKREIETTSEFIYIISGQMDIEILDEKHNTVQLLCIKSNMGFLQFFGGHKIKMKAGTNFFEIKQGPYIGKAFDKYEL